MPTHTPSKVSIAISISSTYYNISIIQTGKRLSISILQTKHTHPNQFTTNLSQANPTQPYPSIPNPPVLRPLHPKLRNRHARSLARTRSSKEKTRQRECRNPSAVPGFPSPAFLLSLHLFRWEQKKSPTKTTTSLAKSLMVYSEQLTFVLVEIRLRSVCFGACVPCILYGLCCIRARNSIH